MMGSVIKNKYKCYFLNRLGRKGRLYTGYLLIVQLNVHDFVVEERNNKHSVNWRPPPPLFLDEIEARRAETFFLRLPPLVSGSGWAPLSASPLIWRYGSATAYIQFYLGAPPRESELTCSLSLDKFPRRNSYIQLTVYCSWANWAEAFCNSQSMCYTCAWVLVKNCLYRVPDCTGSDQGRTLWLPGVCWNAHLLEITQTTMDRLRNWTRPKGLEHAEG